MSQPKKWCFYDEYQPFKKFEFSPQDQQVVERGFQNYLTNKVQQLNIGGCVLDFRKMEYTFQGRKYRISPNAGCVPYKVNMGGDPEGLSEASHEALSKIDPTKIAHMWLWWDSPQGTEPFTLYENYSETNPMWTHYSPPDEKKIEELYNTNSQMKGYQPFNNTFCVIFFCDYGGKGVVNIQGRIEDECNYSMPDNQKRRRPIIRAAYCWCWDSSNGMGSAMWTPYDLGITEQLERDYINGVPESEITLGGTKYAVNFTQGIQYKLADTSRKRAVKRFGTEFTRSFMRSVQGSGGEISKYSVPPNWEKPQQKSFIKSTAFTPEEGKIVNDSVNAFQQAFTNGTQMQPYSLKFNGCQRLQNTTEYKKYTDKKRVIAAKNIPALPSTQTLAKGDVKSFFIDKATNEFYFWYFAPNINDILSGKPLKKAIDTNSRYAQNEGLHCSENIGFEDSDHPYSPNNVYTLLLCRVMLGDCYIMDTNMPIEGAYNLQRDLNTHPPVNPATHMPYDSVVYMTKDNKGQSFMRIAIYDAGQIYPEYAVCYSRSPNPCQQQQQQYQQYSQQQSQPQMQNPGQPVQMQQYAYNPGFQQQQPYFNPGPQQQYPQQPQQQPQQQPWLNPQPQMQNPGQPVPMQQYAYNTGFQQQQPYFNPGPQYNSY